MAYVSPSHEQLLVLSLLWKHICACVCGYVCMCVCLRVLCVYVCVPAIVVFVKHSGLFKSWHFRNDHASYYYFNLWFTGHLDVTLYFAGQFVERNFKRWAKQYEASKTHEMPSMERLMEWIPQHLPQNERVTVVHGDFRYRSGSFCPDIMVLVDWA